MEPALSNEATAVVTLLLQSGKTIKEIAKFADLDADAVTAVARSRDLEPTDAAQKRGKELFGSADGLTYQEIAKQLASEGFTTDDGAPMHHLTVASWVRNHGWAWGGASHGNYAPERSTGSPTRSRYVLRLSKKLDAEINSESAVRAAADSAWAELAADKTRVVQVAVVRGAAQAGVTDLVAVKKALLAAHGDEIRSARLVGQQGAD